MRPTDSHIQMHMNMPEILEATQSLLHQIADIQGEDRLVVPSFLKEQINLGAEDAKAEIDCNFSIIHIHKAPC